MHGAALPRGALEDLAERADEPGMGVGDDELDARDASVPDLPQERQPGVVGLRARRVHAEDAASAPASQPMAVTTAIEATRPSRRHFT